MGAEATLQKSIVTVARNRGAYVEKNDQTGRGRRGTPDLSICYRGHWISVEVKVPGASTDKARAQAQAARIHEIRNAGGIAFIADRVDQVLDIFGQINRLEDADRMMLGDTRVTRAMGNRVIQPHVPLPELVTL